MERKGVTLPFVAIWMLAYNHEKFIAKAIEGVLQQKTKFRIKLFIAEDASTDKTIYIVKRYVKKFNKTIDLYTAPKNLGVSDENGIHILNYKRVFNSGAKYIAMCEGDDQWIDPYKLQKQVEFLERNPNYVLCAHPFKNMKLNGVESKIYTNKPMTLTLLFRNTLRFGKRQQRLFSEAPNGDTALRYLLSEYGRFGFLDDVIPAVRNVHKGGAMGYLKDDQKLPRIIATYTALFNYYSNSSKESYFQNKLLRMKMRYRRLKLKKAKILYLVRLVELFKLVNNISTLKYWVKIGVMDKNL